MDGRGKPVADRRRPDRDSCRLAPRVGRQMVGQLRREQDRRVVLLAHEAAQYRVDKAGIAAALFGFHQAHGKIDGGVIGT